MPTSDAVSDRSVLPAPAAAPFVPAGADGFHGVWYGYTDGTYYAGGLGTFPQQIHPMAVHAPKAGAAGRTFFVWGGARAGQPGKLLTAISWFDHATRQVARPRILNDRGANDGHETPSLMLDDRGHVFVFSNAHGPLNDSRIYRSTRPFEIDEFQCVLALGPDQHFAYGQPWHIAGEGVLLLHSFYAPTPPTRRLFLNSSRDGLTWNHAWTVEAPNARPAFVQMPGGNYQVSMAEGQTVGTMFNYNVDRVGRTNLYYVQTCDLGGTWRTAAGVPVKLPIKEVHHPALVRDYEAERQYVFLKDIAFDARRQPVLLYLISPTEANDTTTPRVWHTARFSADAGQWMIRPAFASDNNYDHGCFAIEPDGTWRVVAPTDPGPQPGRTGGDMVMWTSHDEGTTWQQRAQLTHGSRYNHTYARRPRHAHDDFFAFWADGDVHRESESALYFTDRLGTGVWQLPPAMGEDFAVPQLAFHPLAK